MEKQPKLMNYARMKGVFDAHIEQMFKYAFINNELGMLYGDPSMFKLIIQQHKPPFIINDFRMGLIAKGHAVVSVNLVEKKLEPGMLLFVGPGTILYPFSYTNDLEIYGIGLSCVRRTTQKSGISAKRKLTRLETARVTG